jgi:hypothetical protein
MQKIEIICERCGHRFLHVVGPWAEPTNCADCEIELECERSLATAQAYMDAFDEVIALFERGAK